MNKISRKLVEKSPTERGVIIEDDAVLNCYRVVRLDTGTEELWFKDSTVFVADVIDAQRKQKNANAVFLLSVMGSLFGFGAVVFWFIPYEFGKALMTPTLALLTLFCAFGLLLPGETENKL